MDYDNLLIEYIDGQLINFPNQLNEKLYMNNTRFKERNEFNQLKSYIDEFLNDDYFHRFIVLPGLRGVGKSTLLFQVYDYLFKNNVSVNQILYFSCEELNYIGNYSIKDVVDAFLKYYHEREIMTLDKNIFLLIDEAQYDKNWALAGKIIFDKTQKIFMIFTGSNALNLELNADAARRMIKYDIPPLNYSQYLKLKYNLNINMPGNILDKLLFDADIKDAVRYENELKNKLINIPEYNTNQWGLYIKYGGFPSLFHINNTYEQQVYLMDVISKIVHNDMANIRNFTTENQVNIQRVLTQLALQRSNDLSQQKLSKRLQTSLSNIKNILDTLEKTHLIFHVEAFGTASKRSKKSWKYYFASSSLKHALTLTFGNNTTRNEEYEGVLLENLIATLLYNNFSNTPLQHKYLFYDSNKKNVDFLIQKDFQSPIPIEVGRGKKDRKQVSAAIKNYGSPHGIIISNNTNKIIKEDNIIYIPYKTFSSL
ncbi:ATP-binding protein [Methanosphaera sp. BMS]|uniref:ATP-binding protein n=1 Tax=Methanosphaera sp. BMS TaxID=1789762 RepID=UPI000DC1E09B|nr:AAA family ATPase [Methanosphaera sp. BMS]AWX31792.1 ATPase [Methanosphaera sp. BMS]